MEPGGAPQIFAAEKLRSVQGASLAYGFRHGPAQVRSTVEREFARTTETEALLFWLHDMVAIRSHAGHVLQAAFAPMLGMKHDESVPGHTNATDADLVIEVARGDRGALTELYGRHAAIMGALAKRMLGDERDAEDVLHDAFVEAWQRAGDYDPGRCSVRGWLLLRLRSRCVDRLRARQRRSQLMDPGRLCNTTSASQPDLLEGLCMLDVLGRLSAEQRRVLELGYLQGLSSREIAAVLDIPIGTVKSRASAGLARLRRELGGSSTSEAK